MGPWSADLPDVSPPEKQPACQRARLCFKYTLKHASFEHAGSQASEASPQVPRYRGG